MHTHATIGRFQMPQVRITKQRRTADARRRRQRDQLLPPDLRDPDVNRAKQLQRQRATHEHA